MHRDDNSLGAFRYNVTKDPGENKFFKFVDEFKNYEKINKLKLTKKIAAVLFIYNKNKFIIKIYF